MYSVDLPWPPKTISWTLSVCRIIALESLCMEATRMSINQSISQSINQSDIINVAKINIMLLRSPWERSHYRMQL